jgi:hypothetical protein
MRFSSKWRSKREREARARLSAPPMAGTRCPVLKISSLWGRRASAGEEMSTNSKPIPTTRTSAQKIAAGQQVIDAANAALDSLAKRTGVTLIKQQGATSPEKPD